MRLLLLVVSGFVLIEIPCVGWASEYSGSGISAAVPDAARRGERGHFFDSCREVKMRAFVSKNERQDRHVDCVYWVCRRARPIQNQLIRSGGIMGKDLETRGVENQVKGSAKEMKGKMRGDLGDATDNQSEHIKGRAQQLEGKIQKNFGKGERNTDENT
jgi:uncharacterized protein YjbJ (UPF0337 family)